MKIYAIKTVTWIEDYYEVDSVHEDLLFLTKESAENMINEIKLSKTDDEEKFIKVEKEGVQYLVNYSDDFSCSEDITADNATDWLWRSEWALWYYIEELEVQ